ncbi:glycosyltransferase family 25 protein [Rhizobium helianthi]|uniref:Glycosyltransferase family 25 protein n=1 Tax=Rhizobium helianthi TaxID=1132695 RepID=A0ABW4M2S9_9HYPH
MSKPMVVLDDLPVYLINIDRAAARRELLEKQAADLGIELERVAGVDGKAIPEADWVAVDKPLFLRRNGRPLMPGEYGCYKSHLKAFERLIESGKPAALVIEDDISLSHDLLERAKSVAMTVPKECVVKLVNHRTQGFRPLFTTAKGDAVGFARLGPQGSAACYLLTAEAARHLVQRLKVQSLPFDMALERSWDHGIPVLTMRHSLVDFGALRFDTFIASRADYRSHKLKGLAKLPTHIFRLREMVKRALHPLFL